MKRWKKGKGHVNVDQPAVIAHYNDGMGGVDFMDGALSDYRPSIHGKKWYWPLVVNTLSVALVYCWRLYRVSTDDTIDQELYRRQIVSVMLRHSFREERAEIVPRAYRVPNEVRLDGYGHYPEPGPVRKCAVYKINCRNICGKCQRSVHVKVCFQRFHEA